VKYRGEAFDSGDKLAFLMETIAYGLAHEEIRPEFRKKLQKLFEADTHLKYLPRQLSLHRSSVGTNLCFRSSIDTGTFGDIT
jgi:hypothetical protein